MAIHPLLYGIRPHTLSSNRGLHQLFEIPWSGSWMHSALGSQWWKYHQAYTNNMCSFCTWANNLQEEIFSVEILGLTGKRVRICIQIYPNCGPKRTFLWTRKKRRNGRPRLRLHGSTLSTGDCPHSGGSEALRVKAPTRANAASPAPRRPVTNSSPHQPRARVPLGRAAGPSSPLEGGEGDKGPLGTSAL